MNKILIEDGLSLYNKTGVGQYTQNLYNILKSMDCVVLMQRKYFLEKIKNPYLRRFLYLIWVNLIFPFYCYANKVDKIIFTNTNFPIYKLAKIKYYIVLHDLWADKFPETMPIIKRKYAKFILSNIKRLAYKIITVSNTVKKEIIDYYNCSDKKISVIYNYFSFGEKPQIELLEKEQNTILENYGIQSKEYILSVGSLNKRKNIQMLINAFNLVKTDKKLIIVGKNENINLSNKNKNIIFTGYISDDELKILYKNALFFVFPSLYEGFGIPLIDAQSFGVPVLCSDITIFREIGDNNVEYANISVGDFAQKINYLLHNNERLNTLSNLGFENTKRFSKNIILKQIKEIFN